MTIRERGYTSTAHNSRRSRLRKRRDGFQRFFTNVFISVLSLIFLAFLVSIFQKYWRGGDAIAGNNLDITPPKLIVEYYADSPISSIEVEVLNGCGIKGAAHRFTDFLRFHQVDVVNADDADHYDYETTIIIQRNQFIERSYRIAELLQIPKSDTVRIRIEPDLSLSADVTVILGKDYKKIRPFLAYLKTQP
ncbi:MAG: LytR C-terminal domain-containing protein [Candidatus Marinimicrobia bacterium]|nr:LytR C-terminal domain-containing protein [Candidatus Neomarinimicrobiota bacterium]